MTGKKFYVSVFVTVLVATLAIMGVSKSAAAEEVLKVGIIAPLSGPAASFGLPLLQAGEIWKDRVKAEGGLKVGDQTYQVELKAYDSKGSLTGAMDAINNLVFKDKVKYVLMSSSAGSDAMQPLVTANKIINFHLNYGAKCTDKDNIYSYRAMCMPIERYPAIYAWLAQAHPEVKTTVMLLPNSVGGISAKEGSSRAEKLPTSRIKILDQQLIDEMSDYRAVLGPILQKKPDYIDLGSISVTNSALIVKQARELGYKGMIGSCFSGMDAKSFCDIAGVQNAEGFVSIALNKGKYTRPEFNAFNDEYLKKYANWNDFAGECYMAWQILGEGLRRAGSLDPDKVTPVYPGATFDSILGKIVIEDFGGFFKRKAVTLYPTPIAQVKNGVSETVALIPPFTK
jgi:branched-chain amino acid transport system substrate-binding protein